MPSVYFSHEKPRKHQDSMIRDVAQALHEKKHLIAHAPTGLGKTAAVLGPALSYALEHNKTVFFLTPKIAQHDLAVGELRALASKHGLKFIATDLVGRRHSCADPVLREADHEDFYAICSRRRKEESCPFYARARGFSLPEKAHAKFNLEKIMENYGVVKPSKELSLECTEFSFLGKPCPLCPYEVSMQIAAKSNVIICDYFHLLSPNIRESFLRKTNKDLSESIIIIDEAHNIPDRVRQHLSVSINSKIMKKASEEARLLSLDSLENIKRVEKALTRIGKGIDKESKIKKEALPSFTNDSINTLWEAGMEYMEKANKTRSALLKLAVFYERWRHGLQSYFRVARKLPTGAISVSYQCLDPSVSSAYLIENSHSTIAMSGTLTPQEMYRDLLGFERKRTLLREYDSPFPAENRLNIISDAVTTKFTERCEENYQAIASELSKIIEAVPGNVAIFFPSYSILHRVSSLLSPSKRMFIQKERSAPHESAKMLSEFRAQKSFGAVLCAVTGGSFAEGLDYAGRDLIAAVVVGIPLGEFDLEAQALIDYYEHKFGSGWNYGYIFPAMSRAIQSAGRVIRSESDVGAAIFLDKRFLWKNYAKCFPRSMRVEITEKPEIILEAFFNQ